MNRNIEIKTSTGFYAITLRGAIREDKVMALATAGIASDALYRGVFAPGREITGAKRKLEESAPFDSAKAAKLKAMVEKAVSESLDNGFAIEVTEYVSPTPSRAYAEAKATLAKFESLPVWPQFLAKLGFVAHAGGDRLDVAGGDVGLGALAGRGIPHPHGAIVAGTRDRLAIGAPRRVALEDVARVRERTRRAVLGGCGPQVAAGADRDAMARGPDRPVGDVS